MARPKDDPTTSTNLLTSRTEPSTDVSYNEKQNVSQPAARGGMTSVPALIRIEMLGILDHRDVALRAVSAACKLVTRKPQGPAWNEFRMQVVSAVGEAFNNIVLHGYEGRGDGVIEMEIRTRPERISIEMRDYGSSFDPTTVPPPDFDALPEHGWGLFIIRSFMNISYAAGRPNVLTLTKTLDPQPPDAVPAADPTEGAP
jgi:anti-sigma regulatory factor (Ser/Thr protein kinase)